MTIGIDDLKNTGIRICMRMLRLRGFSGRKQKFPNLENIAKLCDFKADHVGVSSPVKGTKTLE